MEEANTQEDSVQILIDYLKGNDITNQLSSSISMVPSLLRNVSPHSYKPTMVSIGPLHHEDENLKPGEELKRTYVCNLFDRFDSSMEQTLEECLSKVNESINEIRRCYAGMRPYSDAELARMMVMDSCFILGFLGLKSTLNWLLMMQLYRDMLLLENQIPFFVLHDIYKVTVWKFRPTVSLVGKLVITILRFGSRGIFNDPITTVDDLGDAIDHDHILGLLHKYYKPVLPIQSENHSSIWNAVELEKAGVSIKPNKDVSWPLAIQIEYSRFKWLPLFWAAPTIKMSTLKIHDGTEWFLRNIIAYEQTSKVDKYFTSFISAIDDLVDSGHDIAKLVDSKVVINYFGSNEEAATMINNICKNVPACTFYSKQFKEVNTYYNKRWPNNIAWLRRTYFNNPWNIIALLAGIILFGLTAVQTYFSVV